MRTKHSITLMVLLLAAALLAACGTPAAAPTTTPAATPQATKEAAAEPTPEPESTPGEVDAGIESLIIGTTMDIQSIARSDYYYNVLTGTLSHMALVKLDETGAIVPMMAEFTTQDAKTWTFTIKEGLTWHDGQPVTADDVKFTLEYTAEKEGGNLDKYEEINVVDARTFELVYKVANVRALSDLTTMRIIPKHIFETVDDYEGFTDDAAALGNGPYKFVRFDATAGVIEYEAYEEFVDGAPNIRRIYVKFYKNTDTMYMALKNKDIDMVYFYAGGVEATAIEDLKTAGDITLEAIRDTSNPIVLVFNNDKAPVDTLEVRQAIAKAIDYEKARELFGSEYSILSNYGFVPEGTEGFVQTGQLIRDLEGAKDLLEAAGAKDSDNDGILELDGAPLSIELLVRSDKPVYARVGELLQANLKEVGIDLTFNVLDLAAFREVSEQEHTHTFMVTRFTAYGMGMGAGMGTSYLDGRLSNNAQGQIMDPAFAAIVDQLAASTTPEQYAQAARACQEYYAAQVPAIALFWDSYVQAYDARFDDFSIDGTFGIVNQNTWFTITETK